jgi:hypothetical protein
VKNRLGDEPPPPPPGVSPERWLEWWQHRNEPPRRRGEPDTRPLPPTPTGVNPEHWKAWVDWTWYGGAKSPFAPLDNLISDKGDLIAMGVWAAIIGVGGYALFGPAIAAVAVIVYIVVMGERRR